MVKSFNARLFVALVDILLCFYASSDLYNDHEYYARSEENRSQPAVCVLILSRLHTASYEKRHKAELQIHSCRKEHEKKHERYTRDNLRVYDRDIGSSAQHSRNNKGGYRRNEHHSDTEGQGGNCTVYRLDEDKIVKLYNSEGRELVDQEQKFARTALINGIPTVIPYDVVRSGEKYGVVFELLRSDTLGHAIRNDPSRMPELVDQYVAL